MAVGNMFGTNFIPSTHNTMQKYLLIFFMLLFIQSKAKSQGAPMVRIAKIQVDANKLTAYEKALKKQMQAAIKLEPGVRSYHAVAEKNNPTRITILEVYADTLSYQKHIQTKHFKEYKATVKDMVISLELIDVTTIAFARKENE
jgi:quinol monooxygenase YgiN